MGTGMDQSLYVGWGFIPSEMVPVRHYFLELLNTPGGIWSIRAVGVAAAILVLLLYRRLKQKNGE